MILSFRDRGSEDIWNGENTRWARGTCPGELWSKTRDLLEVLNAATSLRDVARTPAARLHALKGSRAGEHSISINDQYRICFRWTDRGPADVTIEYYH